MADQVGSRFVVDLEEMGRSLREMTAATAAEEGPDAGLTTARVVARIVHNTEIAVKAGPHAFSSDEPPGRGGRGLAPRPLQYFTAGVAT